MKEVLKKINHFSKKIILSVMLIQPGTVIISWNANSEADLAGYRIYYGNASRNYHTQRDVGGTTEITIPDLTDNVPYYFAVTAYDTANNESSYSEEVFIILNQSDTGDTVRINLNSYNFPNPFKAAEQITNIRYFLSEPVEVSITIFDVRNSVVKKILDNTLKAAGEHVEDVWNGRDEIGNAVANGDYFCEIKTETFRRYIKITVLN